SVVLVVGRMGRVVAQAASPITVTLGVGSEHDLGGSDWRNCKVSSRSKTLALSISTKSSARRRRNAEMSLRPQETHVCFSRSVIVASLETADGGVPFWARQLSVM